MTVATELLVHAPAFEQRVSRPPALPTSQPMMRSSRLFLLVAIPLCVLYGWTRAPDVVGEDAGELATSAWTLGVGHPPGYPLWILFTHLMQVIFGGLTPAGAANLSSGITTAAALGLFATFTRRLVGSTFASAFAAYCIGVGHEIWNHATTTEVYPLSLLILAGSLHLFLNWREDPTRKRLFWLCLLFGAGVTHHPTFQLFAPIMALAVIAARPRLLRELKTLLVAIAGLLLPFLVFAETWIAASGSPVMSWGAKPELSVIVGHYLRDIYKEAGTHKTVQTLAKVWMQGSAFLRFHVENLSIVGLPALVLGFSALLRRQRLNGALVLGLAAALSLGLIPLVNFDIEREDLFVNRVFLMPAFMLYGVGLAELVALVGRRVPKRLRVNAACALALVPIAATVVQWSVQDRSNYFWAVDYAHAILDPLPKNAILLPGGDTSTFPSIYLQYVRDVRRDVRILDRSGTIERAEALLLLPESSRQEFASAPRDLLVEALARLSGHPVVSLRPERSNSGAGVSAISYEPMGLGFVAMMAADTKGRAEAVTHQAAFLRTLTLRNESLSTVSDYTADVIRSHLSQVRSCGFFAEKKPALALAAARRAATEASGIKETYNNIGSLIADHGELDAAVDLFREALAIRGDYGCARRNLVVVLQELGRHTEALVEAGRGLRLDPLDAQLFQQGTNAARSLEDGQALRALCTVRIHAMPEDPEPHRILGRYAADHDRAFNEARAQYAEALRKDPGDRATRERLAEIPSDDGPTLLPDLPSPEVFAIADHATAPAMGAFERTFQGHPGRLRDLDSSFAPDTVPGLQQLRQLRARLSATEIRDPAAELPRPDLDPSSSTRDHR